VAYILAFNSITASKGFGWAVRTLAFIALGITLVALPALLRGTSALAKARTARKMFDPAAFRDPSFLIFTGCSCSTFLGYIVPWFYIATYAQDALGIRRSFAIDILLMGLGASFFGRLTTGVVAQHLGSILTWFFCALISGILALGFSILWGFCSGGLVTLPAAVFPRMCPDLKRLGTRTGMSWGISSFASLIGSPIAGAILGQHHEHESRHQIRHDYLGVQLWTACCLLTGSCVIFTLYITTRRKTQSGYFI
jgi:MFS family permease